MTNPIVQRVLELSKTLLITAFKIATLLFAFSCKILGSILIKTGELVDKMVSR